MLKTKEVMLAANRALVRQQLEYCRIQSTTDRTKDPLGSLQSSAHTQTNPTFILFTYLSSPLTFHPSPYKWGQFAEVHSLTNPRLWNVGGNRIKQRKPTWSQGEHASFHTDCTRGQDWTWVLWSCEATALLAHNCAVKNMNKFGYKQPMTFIGSIDIGYSNVQGS